MNWWALIESDGLGRCQIVEVIQAESLEQAELALDPPESEFYNAGPDDERASIRSTDYYVDGPWDCKGCMYAAFAGLGEPDWCPDHG